MLRIVLRNFAVVFPLNMVITVGYVVLNRWPLGTPVELPMSAVDAALPFLPWTVVPYLLLLFSDLLLPLGLQDRALFRTALRGYTLGMVANFAVWATFPTTYPRPAAPTDDSWTSALYRYICTLDTPVTCLPSAHITMPAVGCWALARQYPRARAFIWAGFAVMSLTILTTKQHYVADLFAGLLTAAAGIAASLWWERRAQRAAGAVSRL